MAQTAQTADSVEAPVSPAAAPAATGPAAAKPASDEPTVRRQSLPPGVQQGAVVGGATEAWQPTFRYETGLADFVVTGLAVGVAVGAAVVPPRAGELRHGLLFDDDVRGALRLKSVDQRYRIRDASDVGVSLLTTWPILVDSLISAWWYRGNSEVAKQIAIVDAEVLAVVAAAQGMTTTLVGRQRPFGNDCGGSIPESGVDCDKQVRFRSFFSGHSVQSFASAAVLCVNHMKMGLLGDGRDAATCVIALGVAATTGTFRIVGDMHYATDVLTGALVGGALGVTIPLLHGTDTTKGAREREGLRVRLVPMGMGLSLGGSF